MTSFHQHLDRRSKSKKFRHNNNLEIIVVVFIETNTNITLTGVLFSRVQLFVLIPTVDDCLGAIIIRSI